MRLYLCFGQVLYLIFGRMQIALNFKCSHAFKRALHSNMVCKQIYFAVCKIARCNYLWVEIKVRNVGQNIAN